ncbi:MAG: O-antigen ligase family protein [Candidatus Paceibacterota bacterium]
MKQQKQISRSLDDVARSRLELHNERNCLALVVLCFWLLIVVTFTFPGRHGVSNIAQVDWTAIAKLLSRAVALLLLVIAASRMWSTASSGRVFRLLTPIGLFAAWGLVSAAWSAQPAQSLAQAGCFAELALLSAVVAVTVRTRRDQSFCLAHLSLSLLAVSSVLLFALVTLPHLGELQRTNAGDGVAGLLHPTVAASTSSLGIILLVATRLCTGWQWTRRMLLPGLAIHVSVLWISNTRLALFLTAAVVAALLIGAISSMARFRLAIAASIIIGGYFALDPHLSLAIQGTEPVLHHLSRDQSITDLKGISGRDQIWPVMIDSYFDSPVTGHGFYVTSSAGSVRVWNHEGNYSAHNIWLQVLVTTGLVGLVLFVWGLLRPLNAFLRLPPRDADPLRGILAPIGAWLIGWGLLNVSFVAPFQPEAIVFFALLGLIVGRTAISADSSCHATAVAASNGRESRETGNTHGDCQ